MSNVVVSLDGVPFQDFEVPERISFGGTQRLAVQQLIGGGRVVNALGGDDGEIVFGGIFSGDDASGRAQALGVTMAAGDPVPLLWGDFFYNVVVAEFLADFTKPWWIPFYLRCVVADDPLAAISWLTPSAAAVIAGDVAVAASLGGQAGISVVGLATPTAAAFGAVQSTIGTAVVSAGNALIGSAAAMAEAADAPSGAAALDQVVSSAGTLAGLSRMSGYINRAAANFAGQLP